MKPRVALAVAGLLAVGATPASPPSSDLSAYRQMVKAERAFSELSVQRGMKEAFLANLCSDGIVFRPGPVNGRNVWKERKNPSGTLAWAPHYAEVASDGQLGFTTGPWEYGPGAGHKGASGFGEFVSVWKQGRDGKWCVALDIGISHPGTHVKLSDVRLETRPLRVRTETPKSRTSPTSTPALYDATERARTAALNYMMSTEREFQFDQRTSGISHALSRHAAADVRYLREGLPPGMGLNNAAAVLAKHKRVVDWQPMGSAIAGSCDLGYDYGVLKSHAPGAALTDSKAFLHIWRRNTAGDWKLALDLENDFPKP